jgi:hypothetical protein
MSSMDWKATAAYLYMLHLRPAELAWEYLRRNSDFRAEWDAERLSGRRDEHWRLQFRC